MRDGTGSATARTDEMTMQDGCGSRWFWLLNTLAWLVYLVANLALGAAFIGWSSGLLLLSMALSGTLYVVSSAIRGQALRRGWFELDLVALAWRMLLCVAGGALLAQLLVFVVLRPALLLGWVTLPRSDYSVGAFIGYWFNTAVILGLWVAGWTGWTALAHARTSRLARLQAEAERQSLEHEALRARLNPHFVFNALNNLRALILEDPQRARELVGRLSNTLRHALEHSQRERVALAGELTVVDDYLAIEAVHFEDRLRVVRRIDAGLDDAQLPAMALQLLVENAVKHGIAVAPGGGELRIAATREGALLRLQVDNPGRLGASGAGHGVGLAWLRQALVRVRGRFALEQQGERVVATLEIPQ